ncbi:MAG: Maf family protein [Syntrophomonas sp.]|nr:Maf family protein [Syntrophomonas sp.]
MPKIILASGSPRRKLLLQQIGLRFTTMNANIEETISTSVSPSELAQYIAFSKAKAVSRRLHEGIIIAADTIVVREGIIMGKPENRGDAFMMLSRLSGQYHQVITGLCILDIEEKVIDLSCEVTSVLFRQLSAEEINSYLDCGEWLDKAGSYAIQGRGALLVERIEGCYFNVVGLPLNRLKTRLALRGINLWEVID